MRKVKRSKAASEYREAIERDLARKERFALCVELPLIEDRLRRCGLVATAAKLNAAVKEIGWECAGMMTALRRAPSAKAKARRRAR